MRADNLTADDRMELTLQSPGIAGDVDYNDDDTYAPAQGVEVVPSGRVTRDMSSWASSVKTRDKENVGWDMADINKERVDDLSSGIRTLSNRVKSITPMRLSHATSITACGARMWPRDTAAAPHSTAAGGAGRLRASSRW